MSASIGTFHSLNLGRGASEMHLQAFVGHGPSIQFSIGEQYCALGSNALTELQRIIDARLNGSISATGEDLDLVFRQEGCERD